MSVHHLAVLYVYYLEPAGKLAVLAIIVISLLQLLNLFSGKDKKFPLIDNIFKSMVKMIIWLIVNSGRFLVWASRKLLTILTVIFDSVKDFFTSKI